MSWIQGDETDFDNSWSAGGDGSVHNPRQVRRQLDVRLRGMPPSVGFEYEGQNSWHESVPAPKWSANGRDGDVLAGGDKPRVPHEVDASKRVDIREGTIVCD